MNKYVCWDNNVTDKALNTEALQVEDNIFLATHQPQSVRIEKLDIKGKVKETTNDIIGEERLRELLLAPNEDHVQIAVLGSTGSGKSHLVKWLSLNLPKDDKYEVVLIPKIANLKDAIEAIIGNHEGATYQKIREELGKSNIGNVPERTIKEELLNKLCVAIGHNGPHIDKNLENETDDMKATIEEYLPAFLYDDEWRKALYQQKGGILDLLVGLINVQKTRVRADGRYLFTEDDFDTTKLSSDQSNFSAKARTMHSILIQPGVKALVANRVNINVDWAIAQLIGLGGIDLQKVMEELRVQLKIDGKELILLIEDFAKTQGIDRQLLGAVQDRPKQGKNNLCVLRSVIASTRDYYLALEGTVMTRTAVIVDMDIKYDDKPEENDKAIVDFAARYLNVVRLGYNDLDKWFRSESAKKTIAPSACETCKYNTECLESFGSINGIGLYPYNDAALLRMYWKVAKDKKVKFNPRDMINKVLSKILYLNEEIIQGQFPPRKLLTDFGSGDLPVLYKNELFHNYPAQFSQYETLLTFWRKGESDYTVAKSIYQAFGIAPIDHKTSQAIKPSTVEQRVSAAPVKQVKEEEPYRKDIDTLKEWVNKKVKLPDTFVDKLRGKLFQYILQYIDWNYEMLDQEFYSGPGQKLFVSYSINFKHQMRLPNKAPVMLELPMQAEPTERDFNEVALALEGIIKFEYYKNWDFENGGTLMRYFINMLETISVDVLTQIRQLDSSGIAWDPVPAITELLFVAAYFQGKTVANNSDEECINSLFSWKFWDQAATNHKGLRSTEWNDLVQGVITNCTSSGESIVAILLSRIACIKGKGTSEKQIIDAAALTGTVREILKSFKLQEKIPTTIKPTYNRIRQLRNAFDQKLDKAIKAEKNALIKLCTNIVSSIEGQPLHESLTVERFKKATVTASIVKLDELLNDYMRTASNCGLVAKPELEYLANKQKACSKVDLRSIVSNLESLLSTNDIYRCLPYVCDDSVLEQAKALEDYVCGCNEFLGYVDTKLSDGNASPSDPQTLIKEINKRMDKLNTVVGGLK